MINVFTPPKHLQSSLKPDYLDDEHDNEGAVNKNDYIVFPAFRDIRRKTLRSLYGLEDEKDTSKVNYSLLVDKSPKGSVDEGIRSLVDLINAHPSFATLSSCSGRISLFDPSYNTRLKHEPSTSENNYTSMTLEEEREGVSNNNGESGKGFGAWLLSSHATVKPEELLGILNNHAAETSNDDYALMFKHEPLLLHVAASNMFRARQLLTIACNLGLRESGLVVTPKRITVAIRSNSLSLSVPISSSGALRPDNNYLSELVREANERFRLNEEKLVSLEEEVRKTLFRSEDGDNIITPSFHIDSNVIPEINLWGHSAVAVPIDECESSNVKLFILGGYGSGPITGPQHENHPKTHCSRSNKIYGLIRKDNQWDKYWEEIDQDESTDVEVSFHGIKMQKVSFTAREGHSSCLMSLKENTKSNSSITVIATFGGRASPSRPFDDLLLIPVSQSPLEVFKPLDIRGDKPPARWGHTFTALPGQQGQVGLLIGGRNEKNVFGCLYILSMKREVKSDTSAHIYFYWEKIENLQPIPRFHHSTVVVPCNTSIKVDGNRVVVFGGLRSLNLFDDENEVTPKNKDDYCEGPLYITIGNDKKVSMTSLNDPRYSYFGSSTCVITTRLLHQTKHLILRVGGLMCGKQSEQDQESFDLVFLDEDKGNLIASSRFVFHDMFKLGSSMYSIVLTIPSQDEAINVVVLGGGVHLFAFGQSFAKSKMLSIRVKSSKDGSGSTNRLQYQCVTNKAKTKIPQINKNEDGSNETSVVYVKSKNAKSLKNMLEALGLLDRRFRMTKADQPSSLDTFMGLIAVPIIDDYNVLTHTNSIDRLVESSGRQKMPFSTAVLGRK